jgi:hypothetical protein
MVSINSKYQNGKIYFISNDIDDQIYVGSTIRTLNIRFSEHKSKSKRSPNIKLYKHFSKLGVEHFKIILLKLFPCNNRTELDIEEERYKQLLNAQLNTNRAHQTAEQLKEYKKNGMIKITKYIIKKIGTKLLKEYFVRYAVKHIQEQINHIIVKQIIIKNVYSSINQNK